MDLEFSEIFRFCRVCLAPEHDEMYLSVFADEGKFASWLFNLTGIYTVEIDKKIPSLVCSRCFNEVHAAILLKRRILDANEHLSMMTAERELEFFGEERSKLERCLENDQEIKSPKKVRLEEKKIEEKLNDELEGFYIPTVFLRRDKICEDKVEELIKNRDKRMDKSDGLMNNIIAVLSSPPPKKTAKAKRKKEKTISNGKKDDPITKGEPVKRRKIKERKKMPTTFECDTCKESFLSYNELNEHLETHKCKVLIKNLCIA